MNKPIKLVIGIIVVVTIVTVSYFVSKGPGQPALTEPIKIGAIYQLTGSGAQWGEQAIQGINIAVEEVNSRGGVNGRLIEVIYEDSESIAKGGVNAMHKLINTGDVKIVLAQQSPVVVALSPLANDNKVVLMDTGSTTPAYISPNDFTFRVSYSASHFAKRISDFLNKKDIKKLGLLYTQDDYGIGMLDSYKKFFSGEIVVAESFLPEDTDFRTQIQKVKNATPQAVVLVASPQQSGILLKQAMELSLNVSIYSDTYTIAYPNVLENAGGTAEGVIFAEQEYDINRTDSVFANFNKRFRDKYGTDSNPLSAQAYDGFNIVMRAVEICKSSDNTECIKSELFKLEEFPGVVGLITFDQNGEVLSRPTVLKVVKNGQFVRYEE